jgi:hypothetical protein
MHHIRRITLLLVAFIATVLVAAQALALDPGKDGWFHTGDGVRVKKIAFVSVKVYAIGHDTKKLPDTKSKQAMIDLDADKRLTLRMLRDVDAEKMRNALRDAYGMNGYSDAGKIGSFLGVFTHDIKEGATVGITYDPNSKSTTIRVAGDGSATVQGVDFMKATWSVWFGKIDQSELGDALLSRM